MSGVQSTPSSDDPVQWRRSIVNKFGPRGSTKPSGVTAVWMSHLGRDDLQMLERAFDLGHRLDRVIEEWPEGYSAREITDFLPELQREALARGIEIGTETLLA